MASDTQLCTEERPETYLERAVFPILMPALGAMLHRALETERRRRFNSLDYLCEYLYNHNPMCSDRNHVNLSDIPFVKDEWSIRPRPPPPLSAFLTEEKAARIIQSAYRGYLIRKKGDMQVFRTWLKGYRKEAKAARSIQGWWRQLKGLL